MGDLFVFIFFGLVSVVGSNFLYSHFIDWKIFLPAISIGLLSVAVLNLNNMRDIENDKAASKKTLVVKMGLETAKIYHSIILAIASLCFMFFCYLNGFSLLSILIVNIPLIMNINKVSKATKYEDFDPELKKVALSTFALSLLFWLTLILLK
jgi:1,4-dihydroxy-2-naphthoate octaprenyltransferase